MTPKTLGRLAALGLMALTLPALADCEPSVVGEVSTVVCKAWPAFADMNIVATTTFRPADAHSGNDVGDYDLYLTVTDGARTRSLAAYIQDRAYPADSIAFRNLTIDTARYNLSPGNRAFGLRAMAANESGNSPFRKTELTLYLKEGSVIRPVLQRLNVELYRGETDTDCVGKGDSLQRTVELANTRSHGYADLIVKTRRTHTHDVRVGEACEVRVDKPVESLTTLRYDGKQYFIPKDLKGF
ncbi:hypothetical protein [Pseudomonas purpurea]|uniref:hypothetical protein n=1 Tax=Pseudomonas purpurea TaxID=3136737 RepID=UPI00326630D2